MHAVWWHSPDQTLLVLIDQLIFIVDQHRSIEPHSASTTENIVVSEYIWVQIYNLIFPVTHTIIVIAVVRTWETGETYCRE